MSSNSPPGAFPVRASCITKLPSAGVFRFAPSSAPNVGGGPSFAMKFLPGDQTTAGAKEFLPEHAATSQIRSMAGCVLNEGALVMPSEATAFAVVKAGHLLKSFAPFGGQFVTSTALKDQFVTA